ncbi:hypothetical protein D3C87_1469280 [compost metagenome]
MISTVSRFSPKLPPVYEISVADVSKGFLVTRLTTPPKEEADDPNKVPEGPFSTSIRSTFAIPTVDLPDNVSIPFREFIPTVKPLKITANPPEG